MIRPLYETHIAQDEAEFAAFVDLLRQEQVASYLEIGARYGGSFWRIALSLPQGARVVAVDLPGAVGGKVGAIDALRACVGELRRIGYDAHLIEGNSQQADIVRRVKVIGPYDCAFIDGDHRLESVTSDWENYGPMARIVAFHDISYTEQKPIHVSRLWEKIKAGHRHQEIKRHHTGRHNGIGVLWR